MGQGSPVRTFGVNSRYLCSELRAGMVGQGSEIRLGSLVVESLSLITASVPNGCMGWRFWALSPIASGPAGPAGRPPPLRMSHCSSRALTLLSSVFGACGLLLVGIAVSTDYWLYMEEGTVLPQNQTTEVKMALHAGLWRVCFFAGARPPHLPSVTPKSLSIVTYLRLCESGT